MDYTNAIHIIPDAAGPDAWANAAAQGGDAGIWATEDDYNSQWNADGGGGGSSRAGSEQPPPGKKSRGGEGGGNTSKSRAIGKMFFKTKLCCKFRAGTCPYVTNCNFAHGMEELRKPPPNWQEIVAAHEEATEAREEHQIPIMTSSGPTAGGDAGGGGGGGGVAEVERGARGARGGEEEEGEGIHGYSRGGGGGRERPATNLWRARARLRWVGPGTNLSAPQVISWTLATWPNWRRERPMPMHRFYRVHLIICHF